MNHILIEFNVGINLFKIKINNSALELDIVSYNTVPHQVSAFLSFMFYSKFFLTTIAMAEKKYHGLIKTYMDILTSNST